MPAGDASLSYPLFHPKRRIGDRLDEINRHIEGDAVAAARGDAGRSPLPVLRAREARVEDLIAEEFGELVVSGVRRGWDAAGWGHGRVAADQAKLGDLDNTRSAARADSDASDPASLPSA